MPELPEVDVVGQGISVALAGRRLTGVVQRCERLRWPVPASLWERMCAGRRRGPTLRRVVRRGKYLLLDFPTGTLLLHLGMSGTLRVVDLEDPPVLHDHLDLIFGMRVLRFRDPRRFGAVLWSEDDVAATLATHPLLTGLGVEPFSDDFDAARLFRMSRGRTVAVKQFILSGKAVIGVGNIYASECLFRAGIHPAMPAGKLTLPDCQRLVTVVRQTLREAVAAGGSSLKDFVDSKGEGGYFQLQHRVYDREGLPCHVCGTPVESLRQQGRSSFFCPACQPLIG